MPTAILETFWNILTKPRGKIGKIIICQKNQTKEIKRLKKEVKDVLNGESKWFIDPDRKGDNYNGKV